jgi:chromosomal replication initiation ATPase DnaA
MNPYLEVPKRFAAENTFVACVAEAYDMTPEKLLAPGRRARAVEARAVLCWMLRVARRMSFPELGEIIHRDHTCAIAAIRMVRASRESSPEFLAFTDTLLAAVQSRVLSPVLWSRNSDET